MATQRFYDGQPGPDIRRELNNFEAILDGTVAAAQDSSTAATSASVKAQQWADAAPGVEVETGKYSAKHWADRAQTTVTGGLIYRGSHSAASGAYPATPSLGDYYKISAAGTLGGVEYSVGDSLIYNGTDWDKIDSTDAVTSVAGQVGAVVLTKGDVGLGNVDNTSDVDKPISSATETALNGKANTTHTHAVANVTGLQSTLDTLTSHTGNTSNPHGVTKVQVGLGYVDNTSDANKPISSATQVALNTKEGAIASGTTTQYWRGDKTWRDFFTDVRAATLTGLSTATNAVITATDTVLSALGKLQKQVSDNLATLTSHTGNTSNPHAVTKVQVGLGNVDNTSDANKPVSTAQANAIAARYGKNNVLGTVSQSAGVPTGAVIERGSNANGTYVRFADGTQICTVASTFTAAAEVVWSYPAIFAADPTYLSASVNYQPSPRHYNVDTAITGGNVSATLYRSLRANNAAVVDPFLVNCVAIGRWF